MQNKQKKKFTGFKGVIGLTALLLGAQIGAGYASGRELVSFFGDYLWFNIVLVAILLVGYSLILNAYGSVGKKINSQNVTDVTKVVFGKFSFVANTLLLISMFAGLSATIAGLDSIASSTFDTYTFPWLSILICVVVILIVTGGLKSVLKAGSFIVPVLITTMLITILYFLFFGEHQTVSIASPSIPTMGVGIFSALFYLGSNLNSSGTLLTQINNRFTSKNIRLSSFLFALFFALGVGLVIGVLYLTSDAIFAADMPLAILANSINKSWGLLYSFVLFMGITMTVTAVSFALTHWFKRYFKSQFLTVLGIILFGFLVSRLGFTTIIDYIYPIKGLGGFLVGTGVYIYYLKHKKEKLVLKEYETQTPEEEKIVSEE